MAPRVRALIVDDEPVARSGMRLLLESDPDIEVVGETYGDKTVEAVLTLRPDLMFLDVAMPGLDGFEVLTLLPEATLPLVIFVTAYDQHATRAFEQRALDYLTKPYTDARFLESLDRAKKALQDRATLAQHRRLVEQLAMGWVEKPIVIPDGSKQLIFRPREIIYIKSSGVYAEIATRRGRVLARISLGTLAERLDPHRFVRIHRTAIVNLEHAVELRTVAHGDGELVLRDGIVLPVPRARRTVVEDLLRRVSAVRKG